MPLNDSEFTFKPQEIKNYNFSAGNNSVQFYENLRYPEKRISYKIDDACTLQRKADMEWAFEIIENLTVLDFYSVIANEEISVSCEEKIKINERFFIAVEGGPTNITQAGNFNVISHGGILLLRDSECERPNVAIHELLHALGFDHSQNKNNIMYNISKCSQTVGDDTVEIINKIYSVETKADLIFENASAKMKGRYLDLNFTIKNSGTVDAENASFSIIEEGKILETHSLADINFGAGVLMKMENIKLRSSDPKQISIIIDYNQNIPELDKENNIAEITF